MKKSNVLTYLCYDKFKIIIIFTILFISCKKQDSVKEQTSGNNNAQVLTSNSNKSTLSPAAVFGHPVNTTEVPIDSRWNFASSPNGTYSLGGWFHSGIDFGRGDNEGGNTGLAYSGKEVKATGSGRVMYVSYGDNNGYGTTVVIAHKQGSKNIYSLYAHLASTNVSVNQYVTKEYKIGTIGKTGSGSCGGYHLHFELLGITNDILQTNYHGEGKFQYKDGANAYYYLEKFYNNPNTYFSFVPYNDIAFNQSLPTSLKKSGVNLNLSFKSPFKSDCYIDIRLALYRASDGVYLGTIAEQFNKKIIEGTQNVSFYKQSLSSAVGTNYQLRLQYKVPGSSNWVLMPSTGNQYFNPRDISITY
jgi:murein DD-endopeptidase MepM/ murein hydrolase activator NlpD